MAFIFGFFTYYLVDKIFAWYLRKYHIRRIAYELVPVGKFWCQLHPQFQAELTRRATTIYKIGR